ncbi:MAG: response regulator [Synechococcales cyanobacterium]
MSLSFPPAHPSEQSPLDILSHMGRQRSGGTLTFQEPRDPSVGWSVYLSSDSVLYATSTVGQLPRLTYLLTRINPALIDLLGGIRDHELEYEWLLQQLAGRLSIRDLRQMMLRITQEALIHLLSIPRAPTQVLPHHPIASVLLTQSWAEMIDPLPKAIERWQSLREQIHSPLARIRLAPQRAQLFCEHWDHSQAGRYFPQQELSGCLTVMDSELTLYELCSQLGCDPFTFGAWSQPLIRQGVIQVTPFARPAVERIWIACIDDSQTVHREVKSTLEMAGYGVLSITEPGQALTALVRQRPALILMDVNMPDIDGYELCRMLRQSKQLNAIPVVMLTERDGLLDRLRAQMLGVSEFLLKPFTPQQLLTTLKKVVPDP